MPIHGSTESNLRFVVCVQCACVLTILRQTPV